jgi:hypothetical protein
VASDRQRCGSLRCFESALHADAAVIEDGQEAVPGPGRTVIPHEDRVVQGQSASRKSGLVFDERETRITRSHWRLRARENGTAQAHQEKRGEVTYPAAQHEPDDSVS